MIINFLKSCFAILGQWAKGVAALPFHLVRGALRVCLAILVGILGFIGSIVRPAVRFLAFVFLIIAAVALVADLTPWLSGVGAFQSTSLGDHWRGIARVTLQKTEAGAEALQWGLPVLLNILLQTPTYVLFGILGAVLSLAGRRSEPINVYAN
ncbi:MAG: hypothetical protein AAFV45_12310 [Pseudomonadota bacterium]